MSEPKVKRLITHKELDKVVDLRPSGNTHTGLSLYQIGIYVYYTKGESPIDSGYSGFARVESKQDVPERIQNRQVVWSVNLGEWLENILSKGLMPRKPNNVNIEGWVQALWTGDIDVLQVPQLALTQAQKKEVKKVLYQQINQQGTIALYEAEEELRK